MSAKGQCSLGDLRPRHAYLPTTAVSQAVKDSLVARLRDLYAVLGAPSDALVHDVFDGDHRWHGTEVDSFLRRYL